MSARDDGGVIANFYDPRNIASGFGRILFAKATTPLSGNHLPEGWVLPGGRRVFHEWEAKAAANAIDEITRMLPRDGIARVMGRDWDEAHSPGATKR